MTRERASDAVESRAQRSGREAEGLAARFLEAQGFHIRHMNWRRGCGEIDLIADDGPVLAFVEVKRRGPVDHGRPAEAVTLRKQSRIIAAAVLYASEYDCADRFMRFDVVEILEVAPDRFRCNLIRSAFVPEGPYTAF